MRVFVQSEAVIDTYINKVYSLVKERISNYYVLFKVRLSFLVLFSAIMSFWLGAQLNSQSSYPAFISFVFGTLFIVWGANGFNQIIERKYDGLMERTATRPLPKGKIGLTEAFLASVAISLAGFALLIRSTNAITFILGLSAFLIYLFVYTPMKRKSLYCTMVGAIAGAIPAVMGQVAVTGKLDATSLLLFTILFLWQFPHFFAIGFLYKNDYEKAGFTILPVQDRLGTKTAIFTISSVIGLIITSILFTCFFILGKLFLAGSIFIGLVLLFRAMDFYRNVTCEAAYNLLCTSFLYLPFLMILMIVDRI